MTSKRLARWATGLAVLWVGGAASATDFQLVPLSLPGGVTMFGVVSTDGTVGPLTAANLVAWRVTVRQSTRYEYTPVNAPPSSVLGVSVTADGQRMRVRATADGTGGALAFGTYMPEVGVHVANYTAGWPPGMGFALYQQGADFEYADLPSEPDGQRLVARARRGGTVFKLEPVQFPSGATLTGTLTTDGSTGALAPAQLLDWHLVARRDSDTVYYRDATGANSEVMPLSGGLSTDGHTLFVARPGGYLGFGVPAVPPGRGRAAVPADFSDAAPRRGQAGWFDPFGMQYVPLRFAGTQYPVATAAP